MYEGSGRGDGENREKMAIEPADEPSKCPEPASTLDKFMARFCAYNFTSGPAAGNFCWDQQPKYTAYRENSFGHGMLKMAAANGSSDLYSEMEVDAFRHLFHLRYHEQHLLKYVRTDAESLEGSIEKALLSHFKVVVWIAYNYPPQTPLGGNILDVIALCQAPFLLDDPNVGLLFPADAIAKAKHYLALNSGGLGAYSDSRGIPGVSKEVADFIERRDGYPSDPENIFLTDGGSKGMMQILQTIIRGHTDGGTI
ncbi:glutamate-glyoxylate aminotransferase 1 [Capsicum galapagoense]